MKREILELLDRDIEFRYAVAGYLGLSEVLRRLDTLVEEQARLREEQTRIWSEIYKLWEEVKALREGQEKLWIEVRNLSEGQKKLWEEVADLREGQNKLWEEVKALREDMVAGFRRHDEEFAKLRQDMKEGFKRHDEEFAKLRQDMIEGFKRHDEILEKHGQEMARLREDMARGFRLISDHISGIGSRWGILAEGAFRAGIKGLIEKYFGGSVERWIYYDRGCLVFSRPSSVEIDLVVKDGEHILVEVKSSISKAEVDKVWRIGLLYEKAVGVKPRLTIVTPYIEPEAVEEAKKLGIEVYTITQIYEDRR
ncbi:MAG: DUF3782 domain-containing protein [Candidatus Bathyarchaeia archaeon]